MKTFGMVAAIFVFGAAVSAQQSVTITNAGQTMQVPATPPAPAHPIPNWIAPDHVRVEPIPNWDASQPPPIEPIPSWHVDSSAAFTTFNVLVYHSACVIVKDDGKRYRYVEGMLPGAGKKIPQKFSQNDIQKIMKAGGRVAFLNAQFTASDLAAARQTCQ